METSLEEPGFVVDIDGFEGPIDLLLSLARDQKVDLIRISILQLADQFLAFVAEARRTSLELAADYLVMAAWLAYIKSRLLLPELGDGDEAQRRRNGRRPSPTSSGALRPCRMRAPA